MNQAEDAYRAMLNSFRTNDLQTLLGAFGRNKAGRKSELKDRAVDLLRTRPTGFSYSAYVAKIVEIYRSMQPDGSHDVMRNMMHSQQRQMMNMALQPQPQRLYQPPQYPQSLHLTRAGLPQVMPQVQRGIYGNGNIAQSSNIQYNYQPNTNLRNMVAQAPVNQQLGMVASGQGPFDMNGVTPNNFAAPSTTQSVVNVKLRKLPFYEIIDELVKSTVLSGHERCSLPNFTRGMKEASFKIILTPANASFISLNRDISNGKNEYEYQVQIRICLLESGASELVDCMPIGLNVRVNNRQCPLPPTAPNTRPGTEARRAPRPVNCTQLFKLSPIVSNNVTLNWTPDGKTYVVAIFLVQKLSAEILLQRLTDKGARSAEETKNYIISKLADVDPDLATTSYRFSLVCPLGKMRMTIPAKSVNCDHLQCFDASLFILMNEKKPTWMCPTCNKSCFYDDIQIQSYFLDVVSSPSLPDTCKEIEILADGSWKVYEEKKDNKNVASAADSKQKQIDSVDLDSDDGGDEDKATSEPKTDANPESSKDPEKLKSSFIDLTIDEDDEQAKKEKDKQENEAQAADDIQPVNNAVELKPQAQVQPQQAVTSSEQGDVIDVDSPSPPRSPVIENATS